MINWEKLKRAARLRIMADDITPAEELRLEKVLKYIKYRIDRNIYTIEETVVLWDATSRREQQTKLNLNIKQARSFAEYCKASRKLIKETTIF